MGLVGASKIEHTMSNQIAKADDLMQLVSDIVKKIEDIDDDIILLVQAGLSGEVVEPAVRAYKENRDVINDFVRRFSLTASVIRQNAELTDEKQREAMDAIQSGDVVK